MSSDGSCLTWLTNGASASMSPDWRPGALATSDPGACGATPRPALVDVDIRAARSFTSHPVYWLGQSFSNVLLSDFSLDRHDAFFGYGDCATFDPSGCPTGLQLNERAVCSATSYLPELGGMAY